MWNAVACRDALDVFLEKVERGVIYDPKNFIADFLYLKQYLLVLGFAAGQLCRWQEEPLLPQGRFTDYWLINKQRSTKSIFPFPLQLNKLAVKWHSALSLFWKFIFKCFGSLCAQISLEVGCCAPTRHNHIQSNQTPSKKIIKKIIIGPDVY